MIKYFIKIFALVLLFNNNLFAQRISNVRASSIDNQVKIIYDFDTKDTITKYKVQLFSSLDNFVIPLNSCSGSIGDTIMSGTNKTIIWSSNRAGLNYEGLVSFEVRAHKYIPLKFTNTFKDSYRSGKKINVSYVGYIHNSQSYFVLNDGTDTIRIAENPSSSKKSVVILPKKLAGNFNLKLVNPINEQVAVSTNFIIKKNKYLMVKIGLPTLALCGLGVYYLINKSTTETDTTPKELPAPPDPQ